MITTDPRTFKIEDSLWLIVSNSIGEKENELRFATPIELEIVSISKHTNDKLKIICVNTNTKKHEEFILPKTIRSLRPDISDVEKHLFEDYESAKKEANDFNEEADLAQHMAIEELQNLIKIKRKNSEFLRKVIKNEYDGAAAIFEGSDILLKLK